MKWDKELDYQKTNKMLVKKIGETEKNLTKKKIRTLNHLYTLLTQLRNGLRINDAVRALTLFAETHERTVEVTASKQKKNPETIEVYIPQEVSLEYLNKDMLSVNNAKRFASNMGMNTHSLRYAFISYMGSKGVQPQIIAKMTGHRDLQHILKYTQKKTAQKLKKEIIEGGD